MEGVTILSEIVTWDISISGVVLICVGIIFLIVGILYLVASIQERLKSYAFISVIMILFSFAIGMIGIIKITNLSEEPYTVYKVTVDDDVSFKEFNEKYEIIKQDGLIYEVRERND